MVVSPSSAVTTYSTGSLKSFGVVPLSCSTPSTSTVESESPLVKVASKAVTSVPKGTSTAISRAGPVPVITPSLVTSSPVTKLKADKVASADGAAMLTVTV